MLKKFFPLINPYFLSVLIITLWIFKTYSGNYHSEYLVYTIYFFENYNFSADPYIKDAILPAGSIFTYKILRFLQINPNNDLIFFPFHIFLHIISTFIYLRIIREFIIKDSEKSLVILLSLILIGGIIAVTHSSILSQTVPGSMTYFAHFFFPIFLYSLLRKKIFYLIVSSSLMFYLHPRVGWMPVLIGTIYSFLFWENNKLKIWFFFPFVISIFYYLNYGSYLSYDDKIALIKDFFFFREDIEVTFTLYDKKTIIFQILSFFLYYFFLKKIKNIEFKKLSFVVLILSLSIFIFEWVYTTFFVEIFPIPQIYALSPPRSFFVYELFFFVLLFNFIFNLPIKIYQQVLIIGFLFFAKISLQGLLYSIAATLSISAIIFFIKNKYLIDKNIVLIFFLIIVPGSLYMASKKIINFDYYGFKKINRWTTNSLFPTDSTLNFSKFENKKLLDFLVDLRKCKDFILFDPIRFSQVNNIAYKSRLKSEVSKSLFGKEYSIDKIRYYKKMYELEERIKINFKESEYLSDKDLKQLEELKAVVLISKDKEGLILKKYVKYVIDSSNLLIFFGKNSNLEKYCKI